MSCRQALSRSFWRRLFKAACWVGAAIAAGDLVAAEPASATPLQVPAGFQVVQVAGEPLVQRPMFAAFDEEGTLYVIDSGGVNSKDRDAKPPDVVRRLRDTNGDGVYDVSNVFADGITFGTGLVWSDNALFLAAPPSLWKLEDRDRDGVAEQRTELVTGFAFNQSCSDDQHGACRGPDGRIYFLCGRFRHQVRAPGGPVLRDALGPWVLRCRPDGSEIEFVSGAIGNPVEMVFLPWGDAFLQGTFWAKPSAGGGLRDALIHVVEGGEYSVRDRNYSDRIRTGDYLPVLAPHTATAPVGLAAYHSTAWGSEYQHNLFTSHFNTGKVLRHVLTPDGAGYRATADEFIQGRHGDVHLTDVVEDADGSLLVINTGGWFRACCPASVVAKPDVLGGIYRVTRTGAAAVADPYGIGLDWRDQPATELIERLDDGRFVVRERAMAELGRLGEAAVAPLHDVLTSRQASELRRLNAVWALCRIDGPAARSATRVALRDAAATVRQAATSAVALHRDAAVDALRGLLRDAAPGVRREAANALGRVRQPDAVADLLAALADSTESASTASGSNSPDRFLEHALIYALIRTNQPTATRLGLTAANANVRRAALIALDQMAAGDLQPAEVTGLLADRDGPTADTALHVLMRNADRGAPMIASIMDGWLMRAECDGERPRVAAQAVRALRDAPTMRKMITTRLQAQADLTPAALRMLLAALASSGVAEPPVDWTEGIGQALAANNDDVVLAALEATESLKLAALSYPVQALADDAAATNRARLAALRTLVGLSQELTAGQFDYLASQLSPAIPIGERMSALEVVARATLDAPRLTRLLPLVRAAGPIEMPYLLAACAGGNDETLGRQLVAELSSVATAVVSAELVEQTLQPYPATVREAAQPLIDRLRRSAAEQAQRLTSWENTLAQHTGDPRRGRELFQGKANCHLCHAAEGRGGNVGPDLTGIGAIRTRRELLDAVLFPSASFARGYEPVVVTLTDGRILTGLMGRETAEELTLIVVRDNRPTEQVLPRSEVEQLLIGRVSAMPQGLESQLSPREFGDVIAYLQHLRAANGTSRTELSSGE